MDNRELWAVVFLGTMKLSEEDGGGGETTDTITIHVVTDKGYRTAIETAEKSLRDSWELDFVSVARIGGAPIVA